MPKIFWQKKRKVSKNNVVINVQLSYWAERKNKSVYHWNIIAFNVCLNVIYFTAFKYYKYFVHNGMGVKNVPLNASHSVKLLTFILQ